MHRETEVLAGLALGPTLAIAFEIAEARRPRQGENVEVEKDGRSAETVARTLREGWSSRKDCEQREGGSTRQSSAPLTVAPSYRLD
jgi:hypothetical protein